MKAYEKNFLIMSILDSDISRFEKNYNEDALISLFEFHKTFGFAFERIKNKEFRISERIFKYLNDRYNENVLRNTLFYDMYLKVKDFLPEIIPFKGIDLLENIYKDNYGMRFMSDIDIILPFDKVKDMIQYAGSLGLKKDPKDDIDKLKRYRSHITLNGIYRNFPVSLELHWRPFEIDLDINGMFLKDPLFVTTVHSVFHYYLYRLYHFSEWVYLYGITKEKQKIEDELKRTGFFKDYKRLKDIHKKITDLELSYPFNGFVFKKKRPSSFERFYFWAFIQKRMKMNTKYLLEHLFRELGS